MRIILYQTTENGQVGIGSLNLDLSGKLTKQGKGGDMLYFALLQDVDIKDQGAVKQALLQAPQRISGGYYRAGIDGEMSEGGPGSGYHSHLGRPGAVGGSMSGTSAKKIRLTRHAFNRTQERTGFGPVRRALKALARMEVPDEDWHTELYRSQGRLAGYLQGFDGRVKTVLGSWYNEDKLRGEKIEWKR